MCVHCVSHVQQIKQFQRALAQPLDALTKQRITAALQDIEAFKPACTDDESSESKIVDFQLRRISAALDALSRPELEALVRDIENEGTKDNVSGMLRTNDKNSHR
jgi:hypothetical protein